MILISMQYFIRSLALPNIHIGPMFLLVMSVLHEIALLLIMFLICFFLAVIIDMFCILALYVNFLTLLSLCWLYIMRY